MYSSTVPIPETPGELRSIANGPLTECPGCGPQTIPGSHDGDCPIRVKQRRVDTIRADRAVMIAYLKMKLGAEDWHGVQDAASDLRDIDSEMDGLTCGNTDESLLKDRR